MPLQIREVVPCGVRAFAKDRLPCDAAPFRWRFAAVGFCDVVIHREATEASANAIGDLGWLDAVSSDAGRLLLIAALLAPAGLAIGVC